MVRLQAGGGSTRESLVPIRLTRQIRVIRKIIWDMAGASPGREIVALYIIERAPARPVSLGATARNWCGGTRGNGNGPASTFRIFQSTNRLSFVRPETR